MLHRKRRLDRALERTGRSVELVWRSFQLDPGYPPNVRWTLTEAHLNRYGIDRAENDRRLAAVTALAAEVGLDYRLDRALMANTFDAHRLVHHAAAFGQGTRMAERLMRAYAIDGLWIGGPRTLTGMAAAEGLPALEPGAYEAEVKADLERARRYGVHGVPTLVADETYMLVSPSLEELTAFLRNS
ncbi:Predicted dithiol-disulfide isomerase, DsbA family [Thermomonospora echinospora]|uniref:Predicted dithiol-disulfide isomerase, DsbA family n=1 Tax=Thermomonospora echinospora TaxID=1992 RepID=A0A1H6D7X0_9ACTN|nr:DsbA family protein [Thermomonospora echinospora]SEG81372.1 Predicted dithiol-disulfide isomerase, DsbA family [Thermomonospora echinospora]